MAAAVEMLNVLAAVAAGAAGVEDDVGVDLDLLSQLDHGAGHAGDLGHGLALDAQSAEEGGRLRIAGAAGHDLEQDARASSSVRSRPAVSVFRAAVMTSFGTWVLLWSGGRSCLVSVGSACRGSCAAGRGRPW